MNEAMARYGRKPSDGEKITKRLLVWVAPSHYETLLEEAQQAGYQSLGQFVREVKLVDSKRVS